MRLGFLVMLSVFKSLEEFPLVGGLDFYGILTLVDYLTPKQIFMQIVSCISNDLF